MRRSAPFAVVVALVAGILLGERVGAGDGVGPLVAASLLVIGAAGTRSPYGRAVVLLVAVTLGGTAVSQRALDGLAHWPLAGATTRRADATIGASLVDDPSGTRFSTRVLVRLRSVRLSPLGTRSTGRRTVLVVASGDAAARLAVLSAGDRVALRGRLRPLEGYDERLRWRHAAARFDASQVVGFGAPDSLLDRIANTLRGLVLRGTATLAPTERALMAGFLLGDTRGLPPDVLRAFRAAGLSHLLAVSGENVAFVLALVGPGLRRLGRHARLGATLGVLLVFGAMTRWEPSVLRAAAMAACAVVGVHLGRPARAPRLLALAVTALLVADPFLLHSVGFLLSCGASLGIALLAPALAGRLRGPAWLRESLATTAAAQLGVAPVLLAVFGSIPLVALPANLLAIPLVGPLTMWGLAASAVDGLLGGAGRSLHVVLGTPTRLMAQGVLGIADAAARVPLTLDAPAVLALAAVVCVAVALGRGRMLRRHALVVPAR